MARGRFGDVVVGTIGDAAGAVVDPKQAWAQVKSKSIWPAALAVGVALVGGYLLGRRTA